MTILISIYYQYLLLAIIIYNILGKKLTTYTI